MEAGNTSVVVAAGDALVEQSEEVMVPTGGGNPTLGMAHLMKPLGLLAVNENYVDNSNHEQQLLALLPCGHQSNAESFEAPGSLSGCVMQSLEAGPSTAQLNSQLGKPDGFDKRNDPGNDSVLSSDDDVDEDSLTITQLLSRTRKRENFENARDVGNEHVLNTGTSNLMALAICADITNGLTCTSEPMEMSVPSLTGKRSKLSSDKQA
ncbi:hypothetical protein ACET3Z_003517 [Daucus carota]